MKLEKNDIIEVDIDDNGLDGDGIAHVEEMTVFIRNAIKGERVRAKLIKIKANLAFAIIDKLLIPSSFRVEPPCPYFIKCGGCSLQHIEYQHTLELKRNNLITTLQKQGLKDLSVKPVVPSKDIFNYRNKLSLPISGVASDDSIKIGFFSKASHRIVDIDDCYLQNFDVKKLINITKSFMQKNGLNGYDEMTNSGDIRHLTARRVCDMIVMSIVTLRPFKTHLKAFYEMLKAEYPHSFILYSNINDKKTNVIYGKNFEKIGEFFTENTSKNAPIKSPHPAAFFQVNDYICDLIYAQVKSEIQGQDYTSVIDAYAGAGGLSISLKDLAKTIYSLEISPEAHDEARQTVIKNDINNVVCLNGDCIELIPKVLDENKNTLNKTCVLLDPPRKGVALPILEALNNKVVNKIIYISCNPATLARDLKILSSHYNIERLSPFDMFPQTSELETLTILTKK